MNIIDEVKKAMELNEDYLTEMAMPLQAAKDRVRGLSSIFLAHWAYIFIMKDDTSYKHWRNELASYCETIGKIKVQPKNIKLNRNFLVEELLYHIDTDDDAQIEIVSAWGFHEAQSEPLPSISSLNLTDDVCSKYRVFKNKVNEELEILFTNEEEYTKEFYQQFIDAEINNI